MVARMEDVKRMRTASHEKPGTLTRVRMARRIALYAPSLPSRESQVSRWNIRSPKVCYNISAVRRKQHGHHDRVLHCLPCIHCLCYLPGACGTEQSPVSRSLGRVAQAAQVAAVHY